MIWFTSDTHFGHEKVIKYSGRPWPSVSDMDAGLIKNWNSVVGKNDEVWHLGDFCWTKHPEIYREQLNGRIHLVLGNHDRRRMSMLDAHQLFESVQEVKYLRFESQRFWLSHYAHRTWPKSNKGSFHLFGHSHNDLPGLGRSMDVGVDAQKYTPISIQQVIKMLEGKAFTNHHDEREGH